MSDYSNATRDFYVSRTSKSQTP